MKWVDEEETVIINMMEAVEERMSSCLMDEEEFLALKEQPEYVGRKKIEAGDYVTECLWCNQYDGDEEEQTIYKKWREDERGRIWDERKRHRWSMRGRNRGKTI
jgi:hypothetical protein